MYHVKRILTLTLRILVKLHRGHIGLSDFGISEENVKDLGISDIKMKNLGPSEIR